MSNFYAIYKAVRFIEPMLMFEQTDLVMFVVIVELATVALLPRPAALARSRFELPFPKRVICL
jgi:hypothetical protein